MTPVSEVAAMILAQLDAPPPPAALSSWLAVAFYLVAGVTACVVLWREITGRRGATKVEPQPFVVAEHKEFATQKQLDETHGRISRERREVDAELRRIEAQAEKRMEHLDKKLDDQTESLNKRIDAVPERTISLLNETKQLHHR